MESKDKRKGIGQVNLRSEFNPVREAPADGTSFTKYTVHMAFSPKDPTGYVPGEEGLFIKWPAPLEYRVIRSRVDWEDIEPSLHPSLQKALSFLAYNYNDVHYRIVSEMLHTGEEIIWVAIEVKIAARPAIRKYVKENILGKIRKWINK